MLVLLKKREIIQKAISEGLEIGWHRAHVSEKIVTKEYILEYLLAEILNSLDEILEYDLINK